MKIRTQLYIDGQWRDASDGATFAVINPATGENLANVAKGTAADLRDAVDAAQRAYDQTWSKTTPSERGALLHKLADAVTANQEALAWIETDDIGKPIAESRNIDIPGAATALHYFADICHEVTGEMQPTPMNEVLDYTLHEPLGVVGAIIPWNFPFLIAARKIGTALAAGNTLVLKPSSWGPLTTILFAELAEQVGIPAGVLNVVPSGGPVAGEVLTAAPEVGEISFTGSTEVGEWLYSACAPRLKGCTLELGGKSPGLVLPDCDLDETLAGTLFGVFLNQGECCCALTRMIVHDGIYDEFVPRFVAAAQQITLAPPRDECSRLGAMVHPDHLKQVMEYVEAGRAEGAKLLCGGNVRTDGEFGRGSYLEATIFADVTPSMRIWREEIFGPVVTVTRASDLDEMVALANDTHYGLAASVWTTNLKNAHILARRINAGTIWLNMHNFVLPGAPYGGFGSSGVGLELGKEGLRAQTRTKNVMVSLFPNGFQWY